MSRDILNGPLIKDCDILNGPPLRQADWSTLIRMEAEAILFGIG